MAEREQGLRARAAPIKIRGETTVLVGLQMELIHVLPRAVHIVGHAAKDRQIRFTKTDGLRLLTQVLAALRIPMISPGCTDLISPRIPR